MQSPEAQGFGRFGGFLLAVSLVLPFFAISFAGFSGMSFRLWSTDKGAFVMIAAYALIALAQVRISNRETTALIYMIVGGIFSAALVYRLWISPPGSAPIGDLGGGGGSMTINGKSTPVGSISTRDILEALGVSLKVSYGGWMAMLGSAFFTVGAFLEWRISAAGAVPAGAGYQQFAAPAVAGQQGVAQQPFGQPAPYAAPPAYVPPADPFGAPAASAASPVSPPAAVPPDPFAPPADPFAPPAPPTPGPAAAPPAAPAGAAQPQAQRPPGC